MDIEKEREAFDQYFKEKYPELYKDVFNEDGDDRAIIGYSFAWSAWQAKAQAVPEGYVLMPIKPTETMVMAVVKEHEGDAFLPYSLYDAYVKQAMLEAQEAAND